jgi:hypothetical protein
VIRNDLNRYGVRSAHLLTVCDGNKQTAAIAALIGLTAVHDRHCLV